MLAGNDGRLYAAVLADGVSLCSASRTGAEVACKVLLKLFLLKGDMLLDNSEACDNEGKSQLIISHVLYELAEKAKSEARDLEEYSCTLSGVLADSESGKMLYFSLGDSIIIAVSRCGLRCRILTRPDNNHEGICVTTTKDAAAMSKLGIESMKDFASVIIFSDGAWREIFNRNVIKNEVKEILAVQNYDKLKEFLKGREIFDDYSFIALNLET